MVCVCVLARCVEEKKEAHIHRSKFQPFVIGFSAVYSTCTDVRIIERMMNCVLLHLCVQTQSCCQDKIVLSDEKVGRCVHANLLCNKFNVIHINFCGEARNTTDVNTI